MKDPVRRKEESIAILRNLGVQILESLPTIESSRKTRLRSPSDVAQRILCLMLISDLARSADPDDCKEYIETNDLFSALTPVERIFLETESNPEQAVVNLSWRCEAAYLLLWAIGKFDILPIPENETELDDIYVHMPEFDSDPQQWIQAAELIDIETILDKSDLIYRMHWATRQIEKEERNRSNLDGGVVQEWHHAINWLTCYENLEWDEVSTDT